MIFLNFESSERTPLGEETQRELEERGITISSAGKVELVRKIVVEGEDENDWVLMTRLLQRMKEIVQEEADLVGADRKRMPLPSVQKGGH